MTGKPTSCFVRCETGTIRAAFIWHLARYGNRKGAWDAADRIEMWKHAQSAFAHRSQVDFDYIYEKLRGSWRVFRGGRGHWTASQTYNTLTACRSRLRNRRLRDLTASQSDIVLLWEVIQSMRDVKRVRDGASTVAVSKFLHFWNPRLFVIVDDGVIWKWVLRHDWVWQPIRRMREVTDTAIFGRPQQHKDAACDLGTYLAILVWAGVFIRAHPRLPLCFAEYLPRHARGVALPTGAAEYDAAAMEWFLLGVVEMPPAGWMTPFDRTPV